MSEYISKLGNESLVISSSGNVGIGTTDPKSLLHIDTNSGIGTIDPAYSINIRGDGIDGIQILSDESFSGRIVFGDQNSNTVGQIRYDHSTDAFRFFTNGTEKVSILSDGNVGIGIDAPESPIDVSSEESTIASFRATGGASNNKRLEIGSGGDRTIFKSFVDTTDAATDMAFQVGVTEAMRISGSGNVGIGTTGPEGKLHIFTGDSGGTVNSSADELVIESAATGGIQLLNGSTSSGYILFGDGGGNSTGQIRYLHSDNSMRLTTANNERLIIDAGGKVGIGTTNPNQLLDVDGITRIRRSGTATNEYLDIEVTDSVAEFRISQDESAHGGFYFLLDDNSGSSINSAFRISNSTPVDLLTVRSDGKVGIGTTIPSEFLEVDGNISASNINLADSIYFRDNSTSTNVNLELKQYTTEINKLTYNSGEGMTGGGAWKIGGGVTNYLYNWTDRGITGAFASGSTTGGVTMNNFYRAITPNRFGDWTTVTQTSAGTAIWELSSSNEFANFSNRASYIPYVMFRTDEVATNIKVEYKRVDTSAWVTVFDDTPEYSDSYTWAGSEFDTGTGSGLKGIRYTLTFDGSGISYVKDIGLTHQNFPIGGTSYGWTASTNYWSGLNFFSSGVYISDSLYDTNDSSGTSGQILSSTGTTVDWIDATSIDGFISGSGTTNYIPIWKSSSELSSSNIYQLNGKVGIGTTSPDAGVKLDVNGAVQVNKQIYFKNSARCWQIQGDNAPDMLKFCDIDAAALPMAIEGGGPSYSLYISSSGNVGIGTVSPANTLHVNSGGTNSVARFESTDATARIILQDNSGQTSIQSTGDDMLFTTLSGLTERMRIKSDGNVGIGTDSPNYKLHTVGGAGVFDVTGAATLNHHLAVTEVATLPDWRPYAGTTTAALQLQSTATRGILLAAKSTGNQDFYNTDGLDIYVASTVGASGSDRGILAMSILSGSGNVGIGTSSPIGLLEINSQLSASATIDYPFVVSSRDDGNSINQLGGEGVGIKFRIAGNSSSTPGNSLVGASIAAIRESASDTVSNTALGFFISQDDETLDEAMRINSSGNVGIGTTSPNHKLDVTGDAGLNDLAQFYALGSTSMITIGTGSLNDLQSGIKFKTLDVAGTADATSAIYQYGNTFGNNHLHIQSAQDTVFLSGSTETVRIKDGNVGIGTTNPGSKLQVVDSHFDLTAANRNGISITDDAFGIGLFTPALGFGYNGNFEAGLAGVYGETDNNQLGLMFFTHPSSLSTADAVEAMRITYDGNVGIGTINPSAKLDVVGDSELNGVVSILTNNDIPLRVESSDATAMISIADSSSTTSTSNGIVVFADDLFFKTDGAERMRIDSSGNVGIGTTSPTANLHVEGSGSSILKIDGNNGTLFEVQDDLSDSLMSVNDAAGLPVFEVFADSTIIGGRYNQNDFYLDGTSGNVGIGTSIPNQKLTVEGNISSSGDLYLDGGIFDTNDSSGTSGQLLSSTGTATDWIDSTSIDGFVSGSGTAGQTALWTSANTLSSSLIYQNDDGIGLFAPAEGSGYLSLGQFPGTDEHNIIIYSDNEVQFEMYTNYGIGNAGISDTVWFSNPNAFGVQYNGPAGSVYPFYFDDAGDGISTACNKLCFNVSGYFTGEIVIQGDGNVGIGTTSPSEMLHLYKNVAENVVLRMDSNNTGNTAIQLDRQTSAASASLQFQDSSTNVWGIGTMGADRLDLYENSGDARLTIIPGGNVGINTLTPQGKLDINTENAEPTHVYINGEVSQNKLLYFRHYGNSEAAANNVALGYIGSNGIDNLLSLGHCNSSGTDVPIMHLTEAGNVGIGTTVPGSPLHVYTGTEATARFQSTDSRAEIFVYDNDTTAILGAENGNVYLGSSTGCANGFLRISTTTGNAAFGSAPGGQERLLIVPRTVEIASNSTNYLKAVYASALNFYDINSGVSDDGYRIAVDASAFVSDADFEGKLCHQYAIWARHGANVSAAGSVITSSFGILIESLTTANTAITNLYGLYQQADSAKNYFAGNLGIGTDDPSAKLQVKNAISTVYADVAPSISDSIIAISNTQTSETTNDQAQIQFGVNGGTHNRVGSIGLIAESDSNRKAALVFATDDAGTRSEKMRINGDGNVGIGNPAGAGGNGSLDAFVTLRVGGTTALAGAAGQGMIQVRGYSNNADSEVGSLEFIDDRNGTDDILGRIISSRDTVTIGKGNLRFDVASITGTLAEAMRIDHLGNVGIGTTSPTQKLVVNGNNTNALFKSSGTSGVDAGIEIRGGRNGTVDDETSYIHFTNYDDNASPVGVHNLGRIYGSMASAQGRDGTITIEGFDGTSYQHGLTVDENGKVGIGTASPTEKLHVSGSVRVLDTHYLTNTDSCLVAQGSNLGIGASPGGDGKLHVDAGGTGNNFLEVANASGVSTTSTTGKNFKGWLGIHINDSVGSPTFVNGDYFIAVYQ